jgi:hypothetical protein
LLLNEGHERTTDPFSAVMLNDSNLSNVRDGRPEVVQSEQADQLAVEVGHDHLLCLQLAPQLGFVEPAVVPCAPSQVCWHLGEPHGDRLHRLAS